MPCFCRIAWFLMIVTCFGYFCWASTDFLVDYNQRRVSTKVRVEVVEEIQVHIIVMLVGSIVLIFLQYSAF